MAVGRMGAVTAAMRDLREHFHRRTGLWVAFAGLAAMFVPTLWSLNFHSGLWTTEEYSHGPIILVLSLWLLWKRWDERGVVASDQPAPGLAWLCFVIAGLMYVPGRALDLIYFETSAFIVALAGVILLAGGTGLLNALKFPLFFMIFMVPLPNSLVGPFSAWMKLKVSDATVMVLAWAQFPVAQDGVIISLGQYKLLVAEACAGMRTLFTLEALGILYLNLVKHPSILRNIAMPILVVPISFTANVVRVLVLALITYYLGDEAGQGFLHGLAGMVLFLAGLIILLLTDSLLRLISEKLRIK
jgi:exosortase B